MAGKAKYDWNAIIQDIENGMGRKEICDKYKIAYTALSRKISRCYPHLLIPRGGKLGVKLPPRQPKPKPKPKSTACPVMLKIDAIRLFNKKIPIPDIAKELKIAVSIVKEIINKAKCRAKNEILSCTNDIKMLKSNSEARKAF